MGEQAVDAPAAAPRMAVVGVGKLAPERIEMLEHSFPRLKVREDDSVNAETVPVVDVSKLPSDSIEWHETDARKSIALRLVWAYMGLLFLSILLPVTLYLAGSSPGEATITAIKELSGPLTAGVGSVTGVIGFVLGYYFKSEERRSK